MIIKDWKKAMEEAGFPYMDFVKSAKEGIDRKSATGWAYRAVIVNLEIRLPNGYFSRVEVKVDMALIDSSHNPDDFLCEEVLVHVKKAFKETGLAPLDLDQDWMKALEEAGCPHMSYVKAVKKEIISLPGDIYEAIVVYLEKEYSDRTLRAKSEVDIGQIKVCVDPVKFLCAELNTTVEIMDKEAGIDEDRPSTD